MNPALSALLVMLLAWAGLAEAWATGSVRSAVSLERSRSAGAPPTTPCSSESAPTASADVPMAYDGMTGAPAGWTLATGSGSWEDESTAGRLDVRTWTKRNAAGAVVGGETDELGWTPGGRLNLKPSRELVDPVSGATDTFTYASPSGRLATWTTSGGGPTRTYAYDGAGRLRTTMGESYHYDVDDNVVFETRGGGVTIHRHDGWEQRQEVAGGPWEVTESVLPMAALRGGALVVLLKEPDGHALQAHAAAGTQEALGANGLWLDGLQLNSDSWVVDGFHGEEVNRDAEVVHKGARHFALRDGMWLQPDVQGPPLRGGPARRGESRTGVPVRTVRPLLYLGLTNGNPRAPLGYSGVYAAGDSNQLTDRVGGGSNRPRRSMSPPRSSGGKTQRTALGTAT